MQSGLRTTIRSNWEYIALSIVFVWMVLTRMQGYERLIVDGVPLFIGNDPWYQYRTVLYTVQNWPATIPYEVWSAYPTGTQQGQFGTLYDQLIASIAILLSGGSPTPLDVRYVMLFTPPLFGALTVLPVYYVGKYLTDSSLWGVFSAVLIGLVSGQFYLKTHVGFAEHNAAEPLLAGLAVVSLMWLLKTEHNDTPVRLSTTLTARKKRLIRRAAIAGISITLLPLFWPPGVFLYIASLLYILLYAGTVLPRMNRRPQRALLPLGLAHVVPTVLLLVAFETWTVTLNVFGPLQVIAPLTVVGYALSGILFEQYRAKNGKSWYWFGVFSILTACLAAVSTVLVAPDAVVASIQDLFLISAVVAEGSPIGIFSMLRAYGALLIVALLSLPALFTESVYQRDDDGLLFLAVAFTLLTVLTFLQTRFNYYLAVLIAPVAAYSIRRTVRVFDLRAEWPNYNREQVFIVVAMAIGVTFSLVGPFASPVYNNGPDASRYQAWEPTMNWIEINTPKEGQLGNPNATPLDYNGTYAVTSDHDYPNGTYGVLTKWDAGHFVTVEGERIPVTNPFQDHLAVGAKYMLAQNEAESRTTLSREFDDPDGGVRYVVVSWDGATPQAAAFQSQAFVHPDVSRETFSTPYGESSATSLLQGSQQSLSYRSQSYYETTAFRLYHYHGSRVPDGPLIVRGTVQDGRFIPAENGTAIRRTATAAAANTAAANDSNTHDGGIGRYAPDPVPAMEHYRLVRASANNASENPLYTRLAEERRTETTLSTSDFNRHPRFLKVFEEVDGATVTGTAPPNTTVNFTVTIRMHTGDTFEYTQHATAGNDGQFTVTLPYSTTGYDNWGPEQGYTNVSARATGPYTVHAGDCTTTLTIEEGAILGERQPPQDVDVCESTN